EPDEFDPIPEGPEAQPGNTVFIPDQIGIDGIPVVPAGHRLYHLSKVLPFIVFGIAMQGLIHGQPDTGSIFAKGGYGIVQVVKAIMIADIRRPDAAFETGNGIDRPCRWFVEYGWFAMPVLAIDGRP